MRLLGSRRGQGRTETVSHAEWACWAAVHGLSDLATRGPLHDQDPATIEQLANYVVDRAITGVIAEDIK